MKRTLIRTSVAAATCAIAMAAVAQTPRDVSDLVGARASSGESELESRGYYHVSTEKGSDRAWSYWWNHDRHSCLSVVTYNGRYDAITSTPAVDCNQDEREGHDDSDGKVAAVVGAAAILGALAIAHKSHHHDDGEHHNDQQREAQYDRGYRDGMYNHSYDNYDDSDDYARGYDEGVESRDHHSSYRQHSGRDNSYGYSTRVGFDDLVGERASSADSDLRDRGFRHVDSLKSGNTAYTIWYNSRSRQCLQMAVADGRADSIVDIHTHPACH